MFARSMVAALALLVIGLAVADESSHTYQLNEPVIVYANKIGPFNNPLETYAYFEMPGCPPASWEHRALSLGEALTGDELYQMKINVRFRSNSSRDLICQFTPTADDVAKWNNMIAQQYWYQLYVDNLPVWATLGVLSGHQKTPMIYTHQKFSFGVNGDRIVLANLTADTPAPYLAGYELTFSVSVEFFDSNIVFENRFRRYLDESFFEHRIHWFSIFNSFMMVLFLSGVVLTILSRTLRADYQRYSKEKENADPNKEIWADDSGWKQLYADVFRVPTYPAVFAAIVGTGWQLVILFVLIVLYAIISVVYTTPGGLLTYSVLVFAVTSFAAGYFSSSLFAHYAQIGPAISPQWIRCMMVTALGFPGFIILTCLLLNFVAIAYDSAQAIPFGTMVVILCLWFLVSFPLVVVGTMIGRHRKAGAPANNGTRVNQIPRLIPLRPWFFQPWVLSLLGGILPFGSIFIEIYFVFTSFWNYKFYYVYGFMLLVFLILVTVTACVTVVGVYFLLNAEDHRWQWTSFSMAGSTALYIFMYAIYFFFFKTKMTGFFMTTFYFTYMALMCIGIGILCGTVGFVASSSFVTRIYRNLKVD